MDVDGAVFRYLRGLSRAGGFISSSGLIWAKHCSPLDCGHDVRWRRPAPEHGYMCTYAGCKAKELWACKSSKWNRKLDGTEVCAACGLPRRHVEVVQAKEAPKNSTNGVEDAMLRTAGSGVGGVLARLEAEPCSRVRADLRAYIAYVHLACGAGLDDEDAAREIAASCGVTPEAAALAIGRARTRLASELAGPQQVDPLVDPYRYVRRYM